MVIAYRRSQILIAAQELGIFERLARGPATSSALARALHTDPRATELLLDALSGLGLVRRTAGGYALSSLAREHLVAGARAYQGDVVALNASLWRAWSRLPDAIRTGRPAFALDGDAHAMQRRTPASSHAPDPRTPDDSAELETFIRAMHNIAHARVPAVLRAARLGRPKRLLDLGGGPGTYAIGFAEAIPTLQATVFDRTAPLSIAREYVAASPAGARVHLLAGDFFSDDLGRDYDVALVSNILHSLGPMDAERLLCRVHAALAPGGRLVVQEFLVNPSRTGPPHALLFALNMLLHTDDGTAYTFAELREIAHRAGFARVSQRRVDESSSLLLAHRA